MKHNDLDNRVRLAYVITAFGNNVWRTTVDSSLNRIKNRHSGYIFHQF